MNDTVLKIALAGLLHDIGKFGQRAGAEKSVEMAGEYCPGTHGYEHVLYTDWFIENILPLPDDWNQKTWRRNLARLASSHHKPAGDNLLELSLQKGDHLSAGTDRKGQEGSAGDYKSARLLSIFEQVSFSGSRSWENLSKGKYHKLTTIEEDPFPVNAEEARATGYPMLYEDFLQSLHGLPLNAGHDHYLNALTSLLERYTWCIPSSTYKTLPDISLYDHALTTAAIAQALFLFHSEKGGFPGEGAEKTKQFLHMGGDLSGIQHYIFKLDKSHGAGVAKLFRARSFYLQTLTRSVVLTALNRFGLAPVAKIMDAGGRFILLLPNTKNVRNGLLALEKEVQSWFFNHFAGDLSLNLSFSVELAEKDLEMERFPDFLATFNDDLEKKKLQKFHLLLAEGHSMVIDLDFSAYKDGACRICQTMPAAENASRDFQKQYGQDIGVCSQCSEQIESIGQRLPTHDYMIISERQGENSVALFGGFHLKLLKDVTSEKAQQAADVVNLRSRGSYAFLPIAAYLPVISDEDMAQWRTLGKIKDHPEKGLCYNGERVEAGAPKTFNILAGEAREVSLNQAEDTSLIGKSFLGALKADVDNLGLLFSIGLQDRLSISRFATLSRMLNHFFSEYLMTRIRNDFKNLYVVFAGGDDLFLLGPWTETFRFTKEIGSEFHRYVTENQHVTLSAGLAITKSGLPVHGIADQAEKLLKLSKHKELGGREVKNAVSIFGVTVSWDDFVKLAEKGDWLHGLLAKGTVPMGLAGRLLHYGEEHRAFVQEGKIARGIYKSHMCYDFARNITEKNVKNEEERYRILGLQQEEFFLAHARLPVSWALYRLRRD